MTQLPPLPPPPSLRDFARGFFMPWKFSRPLLRISGTLSLITVLFCAAGLLIPGKVGTILTWIGFVAISVNVVVMIVDTIQFERWRRRTQREHRQRMEKLLAEAERRCN